MKTDKICIQSCKIIAQLRQMLIHICLVKNDLTLSFLSVHDGQICPDPSATTKSELPTCVGHI